MKNYRFKATELIAKEMDAQKIFYSVSSTERYEEIDVRFTVDEGGIGHLHIVSCDDDMDAAFRVIALINDVPKSKQSRMLKAINSLNNQFRFVKFVLHDDDVHVEADLPAATPPEYIGKMACELFRRFVSIIDRSWPVLMKALFSDDEHEKFASEDDEHPALNRIRSILEDEGYQFSGDETPEDLLNMLKEVRAKLATQLEEEEDE